MVMEVTREAARIISMTRVPTVDSERVEFYEQRPEGNEAHDPPSFEVDPDDGDATDEDDEKIARPVGSRSGKRSPGVLDRRSKKRRARGSPSRGFRHSVPAFTTDVRLMRSYEEAVYAGKTFWTTA